MATERRPNAIKVVPTLDEWAQAIVEGGDRMLVSTKMKEHLKDKRHDEHTIDFAGRLGEVIVARYLVLRLGPVHGTFSRGDVGHRIQVRTTFSPQGGLLYRPHKDKPDHIYILVRFDMDADLGPDGELPPCHIVGWLPGKECQAKGRLFKSKDTLRVNPADLNDIGELLDSLGQEGTI